MHNRNKRGYVPKKRNKYSNYSKEKNKPYYEDEDYYEDDYEWQSKKNKRNRVLKKYNS